MTSKRWVCFFFLLLFIGIGGFMALNYRANPLGYFTNEKGLDYYWFDDFDRSIKSKYVLAHKDEIRGVVLGGSKAGVIDTDQLTELTGLPYYNLHVNYGNYADYRRLTEFLAENTDIQEIILHISSYEVQKYDRTSTGNAYKVPAVFSRNPMKEGVETLSYLMTDIRTSLSSLKERSANDISYANDLTTGEWNRKENIERFRADSDKFLKDYVLKSPEDCLKKLFTENTNDTKPAMQEARTKGIEDIRSIKKICDAHGITLRVIIGASFLYERRDYECNEYYSFLRQMVGAVGEVWDFSDYCDVNLNPYNFLNRRHYFHSTGALILNTVFGKEYHEGFGQLLTMENIDEYLVRRKEKYEALREEYLETGDVALQGLDDESYIPLERYGY